MLITDLQETNVHPFHWQQMVADKTASLFGSEIDLYDVWIGDTEFEAF